jgi:GH24 family phage-related lysozyme (muramidase)
MSGIGHAPVGPVEGTWVVVMFRDDDEQQPIILGAIGGIPQKEQNSVGPDDDGMILKQDGQMPATDAQTTTNANGQTQQTSQTATPAAADASALKSPNTMSISADGLALIKQSEGCKLIAYQDSVGIWTIGYGSTRINGVAVQPGQTITQAQADQALVDHINKNVAPSINNSVKAPITQSMYDAMASLAYNIGGGGLAKSSIVSEINAGRYESAAGIFPQYNKAGGKAISGLTTRRKNEAALFLKDGVPNATGGITPTAPANAPVGSPDPTNAAQNGTTATNNGMSPQSSGACAAGFKDPNGKYPLYTNEPDTNKLARHEDIAKTIVRKKEIARDMKVPIPGNKSWDQSPIPYNATYPFNHVFMSESGHVMEFDDTEKKERTHLYHKSGTFVETDANGTQVTRIVGDKYEILERHGYVHIKGAVNVTVNGDANVKVENALNVDVSGKTIVNVFNDVDFNVSGKLNISVKEDFNLRAANINMESWDGSINMNSSKNIYTESAFVTSMKAGASWNADGAVIQLNSGGSADAPKSGLDTPINRETPTEPEFAPLTVMTRGADAAGQYETPDECAGGASDTYVQKGIQNGTVDPAQQTPGTPAGSTAASPNGVAIKPTTGKNEIAGMTSYPSDLQLSKSYTLGGLTSGGSRPVVDQQGLTKAQIVSNLKVLAENVLDTVKSMYPAININSGFRRPGDVADSSPTSQHYLGQAADIGFPSFNRTQIYEAVQEIQKAVPYDQMILEYNGSSTCWLHVSCKESGNRNQVLTIENRKTINSGGFTLVP